jgi:hypothetical protein
MLIESKREIHLQRCHLIKTHTAIRRFKVPYQRRFEQSPPRKVAKKEELLVFAPVFAPFRVPEEEETALPFLVDGPTDAPALALWCLLLVVVLANVFRDVCAGARAGSAGPSSRYSIPCCFLSCSKFSLRSSRSCFDLTILSGW